MDFKQIQELIKMINKSEISELKIEQGDFKLTIRNQSFSANVVHQPQIMMAPMPGMQANPQTVVIPPSTSMETPKLAAESETTQAEPERVS